MTDKHAPEATFNGKWINCADRLPEIPNPLPDDTADEMGVVFVNRVHSCAYLWFPSYGQDPTPRVTEDGHWSIEQYWWLEESDPSTYISDMKYEIERLKLQMFEMSEQNLSDGLAGQAQLDEDGNLIIRLKAEIEKLKALLGDALASHEQYGNLSIQIENEIKKALQP